MSGAANLHPGGREPIRPGDRWLVLRRSGRKAWACEVIKAEGRGVWRVSREGSTLQRRVHRDSFLVRLGPSPTPGVEAGDEVVAELRKLRAEIGRLAELVAKLAD